MKQVTVRLDGILFTGALLRQYAEANHDITLVVRLDYYEVGGNRFAATQDDSVLRVGASTLVDVSEVA